MELNLFYFNNVLFPHTLKTLENEGFSDIFRGYENGPLA